MCSVAHALDGSRSPPQQARLVARRKSALLLRNFALSVAGGLLAIIGLDRAFPPPLERAGNISAMVTDRAGRPLRAFPTDKGGWRFAANVDGLDPEFVKALIRVEDKRFYQHGGTDWLGMVRAAGLAITEGSVVSGGSTLTMQTARMLEPRPRTIKSKLIEIVRAHQIEARLSKDEILELYLTLTPYGGNLEGVRAASWSYFGHEADRLSDDEIALLIALPQSPEVRRPDRRPEQAAKARDWVATKMNRYGLISADQVGDVAASPIPKTRRDFPARAWHGTAKSLAAGPRGDVRSTLDAALQAEIETIAASRAMIAGEQVQVSALVIDIPTRAVRAVAGSASRDRPGGWLDLTAQPRSPGSTLKPFIYAMAFDDGSAAPDTRIMDLPKRFSAYQPENFDRSFRGDVLVSEALQHSLNVPAVLTLDRIGPQRFAAQLRMAGADPRIHGGATRDAGLALALGGAGLTARDLGLLYAALGDGGVAKPLVWRADEESAMAGTPGRRLMGEASAAEIIDILQSAPTPEGRMPGRLTASAPQIAFKTGTSYGYRDSWAAAVSGHLAIVVWVGRADGAPRPGHTGRSDALPILFQIADRAAHHLSDEGASGARLMTQRLPDTKGARANFGSAGPVAPSILFPPPGAELWAGDIGGEAARAFVLAGRGEGPLNWFIDGAPSQIDDAGAPIWSPQKPGFYTVTAVDPDGRSSGVKVRVLAAEAR
jgi:penicillin-binding protein 1C